MSFLVFLFVLFFLFSFIFVFIFKVNHTLDFKRTGKSSTLPKFMKRTQSHFYSPRSEYKILLTSHQH